MKQSRLDQLADGLFAIVMTILVFEIRLPDFYGAVSDQTLIDATLNLYPLFFSYILSFSLLFTYWRNHHYIASVYAKNLDIKLTNINAVFLFFVALVPFSATMLGQYHHLWAAVLIFGTNIILIGISLYAMRNYAENSKNINTEIVSETENRHAYIRILFPVFCAGVAIILALYNTNIALFLFTIGILFNLSTRSTRLIDEFMGWSDQSRK